MTAPAPSTPPVSDDQLVHKFTLITAGFCGALVLILALALTVLVPHGSVSTQGVVVGLGLGLWSWFGSRLMTSSMLAGAARSGGTNPGGAVATIAFAGIAIAETPALVGLALVYVIGGGQVGQLVVAVPISIVAIIVNASGPGAIRRHLDRLRA